MSNVRRVFRKYDLQIVFVSSILFGLTLYSFNQTREFGANFITEISGVAITVFLVNRILKRRERQKTSTIDFRILKELQSIFASHLSIWKHLYWKYVPDGKILNDQNLIDLYPKVVESARLSENFEIISSHHPESWKLFFHNKTIRECFENHYTTVNEDIKLLIDNFKFYLEPQLLDILLEIMEGDYMKNVKTVFQSEETVRIIVDFGLDPDKLDSYIEASNVDHFKKMFELNNYCEYLKNNIAEFMKIKYEAYDIKTYFKNPVHEYQMINK